MRERDVVVRVEVASDVLEGEPAHLDEAEDGFWAQQTVVLLRVAHVSVGGDQARHGVEELRSFDGIGGRLVGKVAHFDARGAERVLRVAARCG